MTEPHEESDAVPASSEPVPETGAQVPPTSEVPAAPEVPDEPEVPASPAPEPTQTAPGALWAAPEGSSSGGLRRGCVLVALIGALFVLGVFVYLIFLGARVAERAGTIEFGTGGTGCSVTGAATTFPASVSIRSVAYLEHDVAAGTTITTTATLADGTSSSTDETFDQNATCVTQAIESGLPPGHYNLEYRLGTEILATGGFDINPDR